MNAGAPLVVVGNPGNRRVEVFRAAAAHGWPGPVELLPWRRLAAGPVRLPAGAVVRIDSPGEDAEVDRLLRGAATAAEHGEIIGLAAWYAGLRAALDRLTRAAASAGATLLNDPDDIAVMFDKRACHARLAGAGVPVPAALPTPPRDYGELRAAMRLAGWARVFVKPAHGSSASGVLALQAATGRVQATTSVELAADGRLFNSLRVRRYRTEREVAAIVDRLAPDGLQVERWFPKVGLAERTIDLRVLVVAGEPGHVVVRTSPGPLTNLHLGNARGDLAAVRAAMGRSAYEAAMHSLRTRRRLLSRQPARRGRPDDRHGLAAAYGGRGERVRRPAAQPDRLRGPGQLCRATARTGQWTVRPLAGGPGGDHGGPAATRAELAATRAELSVALVTDRRGRVG